MLDRHAVLTALTHTDIFRNLAPGRVELFADLGDVVDLPPDTILGVQGGRSEHLYVILEGTVQLSAPSVAGYLPLRNAGPGETIPLSALVGNGRLVTTAVAVSGVLAYQLPVAHVQRLVDQYPDVGASLFRQIAEILGERYRRTVDQWTAGLAGDKSVGALSSLVSS